jgi:hypothetical protein
MRTSVAFGFERRYPSRPLPQLYGLPIHQLLGVADRLFVVITQKVNATSHVILVTDDVGAVAELHDRPTSAAANRVSATNRLYERRRPFAEFADCGLPLWTGPEQFYD